MFIMLTVFFNRIASFLPVQFSLALMENKIHNGFMYDMCVCECVCVFGIKFNATELNK